LSAEEVIEVNAKARANTNTRSNNVPSWLDQFLLAPLRDLDDHNREFLASPESKKFDWKIAVIYVSVAALLSYRYYYFKDRQLNWLLDLLAKYSPGWGLATQEFLQSSENQQLTRLSFWALGQFVTYVVIPALIVKFVFRERLVDYGLKLRGMFSGWQVYLLMYLGILPIVLYVSYSPSFQSQYPFYRPASGEALWPRFWIWQAMYAVQFISLEFFFRGYMLHGTKHRLGLYAIFVMTIPYCMIHFGKPFRETIGAIVAGVLLGFMSLKTRSIWLGAALHIAVAVTMDLSSLAHRVLP